MFMSDMDQSHQRAAIGMKLSGMPLALALQQPLFRPHTLGFRRLITLILPSSILSGVNFDLFETSPSFRLILPG